MAKRIKKKGISSSDLKASLKGLEKKSNSRLAYFNITEDEINQNPEKVVKELSHTVAMIPLSQISANHDQPRKDFDEEALQELVDSIKEYGLIQPITLRRFNDKEYQIISGERRYRASKLAGLEEIPAYIRIANDQEMMEMALVENIQREDLNPMEIAITYKRLIDEFDLNQHELAERVSRKRTTVTNFLVLLTLPPNIQDYVRDGEISMGHARELARLDGYQIQDYFLQKILDQNLSVRKLEALIREYKNPTPKKTVSNNTIPEEYQNVEKSFQEFFGSKKHVKLKMKDTEKGKGQLVLSFNSVEELNNLLDRLDD